MRFFFDNVRTINEGFRELLPTRSGESEEQGSESGTEETASETFDEKWGWIANVDAVSELCHCSWDDVWRMQAMEFLNILSYRKDKLKRQEAELDEWKRTH